MIQYIKSLLGKFHKKKDTDFVLFSIDKDCKLHIEILLNSNEIQGSQRLGDFLYGINNGLYADELLATLIKISKNNSGYTNYVNKTILRWHSLIGATLNTKEQESKPIIRPSQFSESSK